MRLLTILVLAFLTAAGMGLGAPITVNYEGSILEGQPGVDQGLPIYLSQSPNNVRFRFFVPDYASLTLISSINVSFDLFDDNANGFERGDVVFVLNGIGKPNALITGFGGLLGFPEASPLHFTLDVPGSVLPDALLEIQGDGVFFVRINRNGNNQQGNDFYVDNVTVTIDGEAVPEPASIGLVAGGLGLGFFYLRQRRKRNG